MKNKLYIIYLITSCFLYTFIYAQPPEFAFTPTTSSGLMYGQAQLNGIPLSSDDWLAAFDEDGNCSGANRCIIFGGIAYVDLRIYGDDPDTQNIDEGMNSGEDFTLQLYDASADVIYVFPDNVTPTAFSGWQANNGAPMPGYDDDNVVYNFTINTFIVDAGTDQTICEGDTIPLNATTTGGVSYQWSDGSSLSDASSATPMAFPTTTTTYTVTVSDGGNTGTDQITVTVLPAPAADAGIDTSICAGNAIRLEASGGDSYIWTPSASLTNANVNNPIAFPNVDETYTVEVTGANGCKAKDEVMVTVNPNPVVTVNASSTSLCRGDTVQLLGDGADTYQWLTLGDISANDIPNPFGVPDVTTSYTVVGTDANGCESGADILIDVTTVPADAGLDSTICAGDVIDLQASGGVSYAWDNGAGTGATPSVSPMVTTTYTVTVTDATGCSDTSSVIITVDGIVGAMVSNDTTICAGESVSLQASGGATYQWDNGLGTNATQTVSPTTTTTYTVTISDGGTCPSVEQVTVTVNPLPTAGAGNDTTICSGDAITLQATGGSNYVWDNNIGNGANPSVSPTVTTIYTVTVTDANGCTDTDQVTVTVEDCGFTVYGKVWLEGAYDNGTMHTQLNQSGTLTTEQPYHTAPWTYDGLETLGAAAPNIVDWVLVELRDATNPTILVERAALLVNQNGELIDPTTLQTGWKVDDTYDGGNYYMVVRHRNHLAVMTASTLTLMDQMTVDFTVAANIMGGVNQLTAVGSGIHALKSGDITANGIITVEDFNDFVQQLGSNPNGYLRQDCNLDGTVTIDDFNLYTPNSSSIGVQVIRY